VGSKTLQQQNPPVLNWRCQLTQVDACSGHKTVVVGVLVMSGFCGRQVLVIQHPVTTHQPITAQCLLAVKSQKSSPVDSRPNNDGNLLVAIGSETIRAITYLRLFVQKEFKDSLF